jgi:hypothetical protein
MKNFTTKMTIAAAAMLVVAGAASAQPMRADVPFSFRTGDKVMDAGHYEVSMSRMDSVVTIRSIPGNNSALLLPYAHLDGGKEGDAKLIFSCREGDCTLVQAWSGNPNVAYAFPHPKDRKSDATLYEIRLHR